MRAAFFGIYIIYKTVNIFLVTVVILQGNFNDCIVFCAVKINWFRIDFFFFAVQVFDKGTYAAFKMKIIVFPVFAFVDEFNVYAVV